MSACDVEATLKYGRKWKLRQRKKSTLKRCRIDDRFNVETVSKQRQNNQDPTTNQHPNDVEHT